MHNPAVIGYGKADLHIMCYGVVLIVVDVLFLNRVYIRT